MRKFVAEHEIIFLSAILYLGIVFFFRVGFAMKHTESIPTEVYTGTVLADK